MIDFKNHEETIQTFIRRYVVGCDLVIVEKSTIYVHGIRLRHELDSDIESTFVVEQLDLSTGEYLHVYEDEFFVNALQRFVVECVTVFVVRGAGIVAEKVLANAKEH